MVDHLFQGIFDLYNSTLFDGVEAVISAGLTAMAALLQILGAMFIAVFGFITMTGEMSARTGFSLICRLLITQAALTPTYYNTYVRDVMLNWLPNWIATSLGTGSGTNAAAEQFDALRSAVVHLVAGMQMQATGFSNIAKSLEIGLIGGFCEVCIGLAFGMWVFTRGLLALIVAVGPFVIAGNLFSATRPFVERWLGKLGGIGILLLLVTVLLRIVVIQYGSFIRNAQGGEGLGLDNGIEALMGILISLLFGLGLLFFVPYVAMSIGAGAAFSPANFVASIASRMGAAARGTTGSGGSNGGSSAQRPAQKSQQPQNSQRPRKP